MGKVKCLAGLGIALFMAGCSTTNSIPYKASTSNVISIQKTLNSKGGKVSVGEVAMAPGVEESPTCRLMGPIKVAPGKSPSQYIKDAFIEELFMAEAYEPDSGTVINAQIEDIKFSSISPASWEIAMSVNSTNSSGYMVSVDYHFNTSWDAYSACRNVADAFGPAVQELLGKVVKHPQFPALVN